jgi:hypothetical protein
MFFSAGFSLILAMTRSTNYRMLGMSKPDRLSRAQIKTGASNGRMGALVMQVKRGR